MNHKEIPAMQRDIPFRSYLFGPHGRRTDLVRAYGELEEVCTQLGFGTELTLGEWSMSPNWAVLILARAAQPPPPSPARDWGMASIPEVIADLVTAHHIPLRHELGRIGTLIDHLVDAHPHANLTGLRAEFILFRDEIELHMKQEECELFPLCIELENARFTRKAMNDRDLTALIRSTSHSHVEFDSSLQGIVAQIQIAAANLNDPDLAIVHVGVVAMAHDLVIHSAKEAEILIPAAIFNEELLRIHSMSLLHGANERE